MSEAVAVNHEEFWQVRLRAMEWQYVLMRMMVRHSPPDAWNDWIITQPDEMDGDYLYLLKRTVFTVSELAKAFGTTEQAIEATKIITLKEPASNKDMPKPTVGYYGEA